MNTKELQKKILSALINSETSEGQYKISLMKLSPDNFIEPHKTIFAEIKKRSNLNQTIDAFSLTEVLGKQYEKDIIEISCDITTMDIDYLIDALLSSCWRVESAAKLSALAQKIFHLSPFDSFESLRSEIQNALKQIEIKIARETKTTKVLIDEFYIQMDDRIDRFKKGEKFGISTGFKDIDDRLHGFMPGRFYVIGARPSVGKTTLGINMLREAAYENKHCLYFTVEMRDIELLEKISSRDSATNWQKLFNGSLNKDDADVIVTSLNRLEKLDFKLNHTFNRSLENLEIECRRLKLRGELDILFIDYLQQLILTDKTRKFSRFEEIAEISTRLKSLSLELNIPVIAFAQLNRQASASIDEPGLHHIKDCGSIEQDADAVLFIHRKEVCDGTWEYFLIIGKNRHGQTGMIPVTVDFALNKFSNYVR